MSDFTLSPPILAAILCNAPPPLVFQPSLLIIIAQSLKIFARSIILQPILAARKTVIHSSRANLSLNLLSFFLQNDSLLFSGLEVIFLVHLQSFASKIFFHQQTGETTSNLFPFVCETWIILTRNRLLVDIFLTRRLSKSLAFCEFASVNFEACIFFNFHFSSVHFIGVFYRQERRFVEFA